MQVQVLLFGVLKDMAPKCEWLELPEQATVDEFLHVFFEKMPSISKFTGSLAVAVNREYASRTRVLQEGDEVALLPPVSGGH